MLEFNIAECPFSYRGAWTSLNLNDKFDTNSTKGLYVYNHHNGHTELFRIELTVLDEVKDYTILATPSLLQLSVDENSFIRICYEDSDTIRFFGQNVDMRLSVMPYITSAYFETEKLLTLNFARKAIRRYNLECLRGAMNLTNKEINITSNDSDCWEIALDEYWSSWTPKTRDDFCSCVEIAQKKFSKFLKKTLYAPSELEATRELAAYINWSSIVNPCGLIKRSAMLMSKNWMDNIWSWDNCFNALALSQNNQKLSLKQFWAIADYQDKFGIYPDCLNDINILYNFTKPPIYGWIFSMMFERFSKPLTRSEMLKIYHSLRRLTNWYLKYRRLDNQTLPHYLHGNDSGWDNSTMFAEGVPLIAPDLASFLILQMDFLASLAEKIDCHSEISYWEENSKILLQSLLQQLWKGDHFVALVQGNREVNSESLIQCIPIILGKKLPKDIRLALKNNIEKHITEWGVATESPTSEYYTSDGYWRGPIWAPSTYIIICGLKNSGFHQLAQIIAERFCNLCKKSGFAENFNALTGESLRDPAYTWTSSVFLLLADEYGLNP